MKLLVLDVVDVVLGPDALVVLQVVVRALAAVELVTCWFTLLTKNMG